jgi:hypothetical protein
VLARGKSLIADGDLSEIRIPSRVWRHVFAAIGAIDIG